MPLTPLEFLHDRNDRLVQALDRNREIAAFVQAVLEHLVDRAEARGVSLGEVEVESPQILADGSRYLISARIR